MQWSLLVSHTQAYLILSVSEQVAEGLRTLMLGLYDVHLAPDGRSVDYPALVRDPNFADYTTAATELQKVGARGRPCFMRRVACLQHTKQVPFALLTL